MQSTTINKYFLSNWCDISSWESQALSTFGVNFILKHCSRVTFLKLLLKQIVYIENNINNVGSNVIKISEQTSAWLKTGCDELWTDDTQFF